MNTHDFLRMFAYDHWANRECLRAIKASGLNSGVTVGRIAHILSAEKLWLERSAKREAEHAGLAEFNRAGVRRALRRNGVRVAELSDGSCTRRIQ